jgi:hypothetical protein
MANSTQEARARRTAARDRRRGQASENVEGATQATSQANGKVASTAAKVLGTAAGAALLGALGGAAKALLERRSDDELSPESQEERGDREPKDEDEEPTRAAAEAEREERPDQQEAEDTRSVEEGVADDLAGEARRQLENLLGSEVERVSGLEHVDGGWAVTLEAVELARIPKSTDVLATYEVVLDEDRKVVSINRGRRYRRSQVDDAA